MKPRQRSTTEQILQTVDQLGAVPTLEIIFDELLTRLRARGFSEVLTLGYAWQRPFVREEYIIRFEPRRKRVTFAKGAGGAVRLEHGPLEFADLVRALVGADDALGAADGVPGDFIETGVWRGGACIFMRAALEALRDTERTVWVADSFQGMPHADNKWHVGDQRMAMDTLNDVLAVSQSQVQENFRRYDLLDDRVRFLAGWFADTLPVAPIERLAILRMDGDLYESTMVTLTSLYPKLSAGGYVIVDDYRLQVCREAVQDYRTKHHIEDELIPIDDHSVYWRRSSPDAG